MTNMKVKPSNTFYAFRCYKDEGKVTKILIGECNSYDGAVDCIDQDREDFLAPTFWHFISSVAA